MIKILLFSSLLITSCSLPRVKTYFSSSSFLDIEFAKDDFFMRCSILDKKKKKSLMTFYGVSGDIVYEFFFRRVSEEGQCENFALKEYKSFVKNTDRIRIVGIMPLDKQKNNSVNSSIPDKFKMPQFLQNWTFIRLQANGKCKAYFDVDCETDNYWAGLSPQK